MTLSPEVQKWSLRVGLILAGALAGGLAQRYLGTPTVEVRTETKIELRDVIHEVVKVEVREVAAQAKTVVVYRDRTVSPAGAVHETSVERTESVAVSEVLTEGTKAFDRAVSSNTSSITTTTPVRANWRVAVAAGASINTPFIPLAGPLVLGAEFSGRLIGPLSGGVWVSTYGAAGLSLSVEF
jgi:hypothetical protein